MLVIDDVQVKQERGQQLLSAKVRMDDHESRLWFRWNGAECPHPGDALLLAAIQPAMRKGYDLELSQSISEELSDTLFEIQQHFQQLDPDLTMVDIPDPQISDQPAATLATELTEPELITQQNATGVLFDGSVDAFYTFHNNQDDIESIVYISDYVDEQEIRHNKGTAIKCAENRARDLGKAFIHVQTNLRQFMRMFNNHHELDHALEIAIIDTLLSGHLERLVIPGADEHPMSENSVLPGLPLLFDSYLPSDRIQFDQNSAGVDHADKMADLKGNQIVLESLRVCWENPERSYNCGRCRKCTRRVSSKRLLELLHRDSRLVERRYSYEF